MRVQTSTQNDVYFACGKVYLHADHFGSASLTTDASGNRYGELRYYPYGVTRYTWGSTPTDRRFTGQRDDAYINLYEMGAQWYDSDLGRWISPDSIVPQAGDPQTLNRYSYGYNNPVKYQDPTGHYACTGSNSQWGNATCYDVVNNWLDALKQYGGDTGAELFNKFWESDEQWPIEIRFVNDLQTWAQTDTRLGKVISIQANPDFASNADLAATKLNSTFFGHEVHHLVNQKNATVIASAWGEKEAYDVTWQLLDNMGLQPDKIASDVLRQIHESSYSDTDLQRIQGLLGTTYLRPPKWGDPAPTYLGARIQGGIYTVAHSLGVTFEAMTYMVSGCYVYSGVCFAPGAPGAP
jgi:RHS repeat-associated protein